MQGRHLYEEHCLNHLGQVLLVDSRGPPEHKVGAEGKKLGGSLLAFLHLCVCSIGILAAEDGSLVLPSEGGWEPEESRDCCVE